MAVDFKPLITLLAVVNPLACVPFFIHYTQGFNKAQRQRTILVSSFTAFAVIAASALLGLDIWSFSVSHWPAFKWVAACCC
jgi:multiple antibiotic resistance protein